MRTLDLALKDISQVFRDRRALIFILIMPVIFTFFFGFAFGSAGKQAADPRLPIGIVNRDPDGQLSAVLVDLLASSETVRPVVVSESDAATLDATIIKGDLAAGLVIPAGYSAGTLDGLQPNLEIINNEESDNGQTVRRALQTAITRTLGVAKAASTSLSAYEQQAGPLDAAARQSYLADAVRRGAEAWKNVPLTIQVSSSGAAATAADPFHGNAYNQFSPGMIVMFIMFGLQQAAMVMVTERRTGAMARLLTTPMTKPELIGGHILGMFLVLMLQQILLVVFGHLVLKVAYLDQPLATLLVMASLSLWVASLGLLISALVKREEQVALWSLLAMFVFAALGGAWFSLEMVGKAFSIIGHLTPTAWAMEGYQNIIIRGQGLSSVLLPSGIILGYAALFFAIAVWKFRYE
jgi:ABC-2 type transport system permease protein